MAKLADLVTFAMDVKGVNQTQLADAIGLSQASVNAIVNGKTAKPTKWKTLAEFLEIPITDMLEAMAETQAFLNRLKAYDAAEEAAMRQVISPSSIGPTSRVFAPTIRQSPPEANARLGEGLDPVPGEQIPVYGRAQGGPDGKFEFNGEVMGWEQRPPNLRGVRGVYAVYIDGESMYPRYKPGETVVAHPGRPIAKGDDVVVQVAPEEEGEAPLGYVKELVSLNSKELIVKQFNPDIEIRFPRERVISIHRIVSADR